MHFSKKTELGRLVKMRIFSRGVSENWFGIAHNLRLIRETIIYRCNGGCQCGIGTWDALLEAYEKFAYIRIVPKHDFIIMSLVSLNSRLKVESCKLYKNKQINDCFNTDNKKWNFGIHSCSSFWWWWWWIVFVVWLTSKRLLVLFPVDTIVGDPHHRESQTRLKQVWTCAIPDFRLHRMKLCSSDNHYNTAPQVIEPYFKLLSRKFLFINRKDNRNG